ncbi:MAG: chorismate pyruvate-lyase family protein [Thermostichales cyanobacterium BF4_bins_65]
MTIAPFALTWEQLPLEQVEASWDLQQGWGTIPMDPVWRMLVLGDGSMTRTLGLLTGQPIGVEVLTTQGVSGIPKSVSEFLGSARGIVQRRVFLGIPGGERLVYAVSWWRQEVLDRYLPQPQWPIGVALAQQRLAVYRQILQVYRGSSPFLAQVWQAQGGLWARRYGMWQQQQPLTLIDEVFSPHLSRFWQGYNG